MKKKIPRGYFVTFEGGEGAGKSTHIDLLEKRLGNNYEVVTLREPGATSFGVEVRRTLMHLRDDEYKISPLTELFLFNADRSHTYEHIIIPSLEEEKLILGDRSFDSTMAYQGFAGGADLDFVDYVRKKSTQGISPDLTFIIDVPAELGLRNARGVTKEYDRFESKERIFYERIKVGFLEIAKQNPERCVVVPYINRGIEEMNERMYLEIVRRIEDKN